MASNRSFASRNMVNASVRGVRDAQVLRNSAFAKHAVHNGKPLALAHTKFQGKWASHNWQHPRGWHWRHHHRDPLAVIGWFGPLFWPYAYWDFIDYTYWPYAYDAFWPYAYDDLYVGVFGPYAYEGAAYLDAPPSGSSRRALASRRSSAGGAVVCQERSPELTNWPIQQIGQLVEPDQAQQALLNEFKEVTARAIEVLQANCPDELASTPVGRLAAMRKQIETMQQALGIVLPTLSRFYEALNDEQKSRFNVLDQETGSQRTTRAGARPSELSQICNVQLVKPADLPAERIARALNPTDAQRAALDALQDANMKAAGFLKANCPEGQTMTPPGRVEAMAQRLNTMLQAIKIVQPALESFYGQLTNEQKARFNGLDARQS